MAIPCDSALFSRHLLLSTGFVKNDLVIRLLRLQSRYVYSLVTYTGECRSALWLLSPFGTRVSPSAGHFRALMGIGVEPCYPSPLVLVSET